MELCLQPSLLQYHTRETQQTFLFQQNANGGNDREEKKWRSSLNFSSIIRARYTQSVTHNDHRPPRPALLSARLKGKYALLLLPTTDRRKRGTATTYIQNYSHTVGGNIFHQESIEKIIYFVNDHVFHHRPGIPCALF